MLAKSRNDPNAWRWMTGQIVCTCNRILFSLQKECYSDSFYSIEASLYRLSLGPYCCCLQEPGWIFSQKITSAGFVNRKESRLSYVSRHLSQSAVHNSGSLLSAVSQAGCWGLGRTKSRHSRAQKWGPGEVVAITWLSRWQREMVGLDNSLGCVRLNPETHGKSGLKELPVMRSQVSGLGDWFHGMICGLAEDECACVEMMNSTSYFQICWVEGAWNIAKQTATLKKISALILFKDSEGVTRKTDWGWLYFFFPCQPSKECIGPDRPLA